MENKETNHKSNIARYFDEYFENTSFHGMRYFSQNRTVAEKIYWLIMTILSVLFLGFMIYKLATKFKCIPVIVSFSTKETPVFEVPLPTVTICPRAKISGDKFNYTDLIVKVRKGIPLSHEELKLKKFAPIVCKDELRAMVLKNQTYTTYISNDIFNFLNESKRPFLHYCYLMGKDISCDEYFTPIVTAEGICYSFNFLNSSEIFQDNVYVPTDFYQTSKKSSWNIEKGYLDPQNLEAYPIRSLLTGIRGSLTVVLYSKASTVDPICSNYDSGGYWVTIETPGTLPLSDYTSFTIGSNTNVLVALNPTVMKTSHTVKNYHPDKRDCVFQEEKPLKYFKIYTQSNCIFECLTNITLKMCNCVAFYMPRLNETKICGVASFECMQNAEHSHLLSDLLHKTKSSTSENLPHEECKCMPICSDIDYNMEISNSPWKNTHFVKRLGQDLDFKESIHEMSVIPDFIIDDDDVVEFASLTLYMKRNHLETKERNEVYGLIDFISGFGGLLGLFTGFSILSAMEIVYFMTLRIIGNYRLYGTCFTN